MKSQKIDRYFKSNLYELVQLIEDGEQELKEKRKNFFLKVRTCGNENDWLMISLRLEISISTNEYKVI